MDDQQANATRKLVPRFSLRTLMILMALAGSGYALYAGWEPWRFLAALTVPDPTMRPQEEVPAGLRETGRASADALRFSPDGKRLLALIADTYFSYDRRQVSTLGKRICIWDNGFTNLQLDKWLPADKGEPAPSDPLRCLTTFSEGGDIVNGQGDWIDTRKDNNADLAAYRRTSQLDGMWTYAPVGTLRARQYAHGYILVQQLRRPLAWYGVFWLYEFYLTLICAIGLAWSIRRDGRGVG